MKNELNNLIVHVQNGMGVDCNNISPDREDGTNSEVDKTTKDTKINNNRDTENLGKGTGSIGTLEASASDSDSLSSTSYGGSSSIKSSKNGGVASIDGGETISASEVENVKSKIDQLRSVATLLKRKADELEASL